MKILHTADWHIGQFKGPVVDGVNLRSQDTVKCLEYMVDVAIKERPDIVCISGDIFHQEQIGPVRYSDEMIHATNIIAAVEDRVVYEWAEDYYHKYEKPETAKKEKGKKPATTKKTEAPAKKVTEIKKDIQETKDDSKVSEKPEKKDAASKQQKTEKTSTKSSGLNGQMSLFDLL